MARVEQPDSCCMSAASRRAATLATAMLMGAMSVAGVGAAQAAAPSTIGAVPTLTGSAEQDSFEAEVLRLYYGIDCERSHTLEEIATKYGLTRERIRQIKERAIKRLKHPSRNAILRKFYTSKE